MRERIVQRVAAGHVTRDCGDQVAGVAHTAALAERHRLARDLHDSVTQTLISLQLAAEAAANRWDTQPAQAREALYTIRDLASGATIEMRALLVDLHEAVLERQGLVAALEAHSAVVRQRSGLQVDLRLMSPVAQPPWAARPWADGLPAAYQEALYRLVQEALANVVKHARATHATVTLVRDGAVRLIVEDNGIGFGAPAPAFAYGLSGMRERVEALGGWLHLENRPGDGAAVTAELPLPDEADPWLRRREGVMAAGPARPGEPDLAAAQRDYVGVVRRRQPVRRHPPGHSRRRARDR
jgi:signal transduction histidine kinase